MFFFLAKHLILLKSYNFTNPFFHLLKKRKKKKGQTKQRKEGSEKIRIPSLDLRTCFRTSLGSERERSEEERAKEVSAPAPAVISNGGEANDVVCEPGD